MEMTTIFAISVGVIAVVHFLSLIAERISPIKRKKKVHTTRKDWYCFFTPTALLGKDTKEGPVVREIQLDTARKLEQRRQQHKRRLVLKA